MPLTSLKTAEIWVKRSATFTVAAKLEERFQNILQVVETDRKKSWFPLPEEEEINWIVHTRLVDYMCEQNDSVDFYGYLI